ncbi:MAG: glycosyltransferase family 2 protein [Candidatus Omnitrophota bacterium]
MNSLCDVVVLTWNQRNIIKDFVESYLANTSVASRLIIIDNGSNDGTREYLLSLTDTDRCSFEIIFNEENKGFVGGMNQGISISDAPYVCLVNNDLIFTEGWLSEIISVFETDKRIGLVNPNSNNLGTLLPGSDTLAGFSSRLRKAYSGKFEEMPFCIGFCMVIKRGLVNIAGGLSKEFAPMFFEDTDYSMKALKSGYLIGMAKGSYVWHKEHSSFKQMGKNQEEFFEKSRRVFVRKWGRILRIVLMIENNSGLQNNLDHAVALARAGNYVSVFCRDKRFKERSDIFKEACINEHRGVNFVGFRNTLVAFWQIVKKKKKYDLIIVKNSSISRLLRRMGYEVMSEFDKEAIRGIKFNGSGNQG